MRISSSLPLSGHAAAAHASTSVEVRLVTVVHGVSSGTMQIVRGAADGASRSANRWGIGTATWSPAPDVSADRIEV